MKVLWITHDVLEPFLPYVKGNPTKGGSWIDPLFFGLNSDTEAELGIITPVINGTFLQKNIDGIIYFSIPCKKGKNIEAMDSTLVDYYLKAISAFSPDIIHIHGIEKNFALLTEHLNHKIPVVCSIQGIINSYEPYLRQSYSNVNYKKYQSLKNFLGIGGIDSLKRRWTSYMNIEKKIVAINTYFIGRTLWDKAQILSLNSEIKYFHGEELLRDSFYHTDWDINKCQRNTIFISSGAYPIKGLHVLLMAVKILKNKYPNIKVSVPLANIKIKLSIKDYLIGEDYSNYISSLVKDLGLRENVVFLKRLSSDEMAKQFAKSHIFVLPSYIENSPNSLGEAMMVGTPSVSSYTGGVGSMIEDEKSSLLFPIGDYRLLAHQINRLFSNDDLAIQISNNAKIIAAKRHNKKETFAQYFSIYHKIIKIHNESPSRSKQS